MIGLVTRQVIGLVTYHSVVARQTRRRWQTIRRTNRVPARRQSREAVMAAAMGAKTVYDRPHTLQEAFPRNLRLGACYHEAPQGVLRGRRVQVRRTNKTNTMAIA